MIYHIIIIISGIISSMLLFNKFPKLSRVDSIEMVDKVSIVIPARNEEKNIGLLLSDLMAQTAKIHEIICVDDGSSDGTCELALKYDIKLISIQDKPSDWTGKSWACQKGAEAASGDLILFLDADVRLSPYAVMGLLQTYKSKQSVISVQPYHMTKRYFEQFSFFFNLIQIAANGTSVGFKAQSIGLYGPVILIDQETYKTIDGHLVAKESIVDDVVLGERLHEMGLPFKLFLGGKDISFRMYGHSFKDLVEGWVKNYSTGAAKTPLLTMLLVALWIASSVTSPILLLVQFTTNTGSWINWLVLGLYVLWILEFLRVGSKVGKFKAISFVFYPVNLIFFLTIFGASLLIKHTGSHVVWKGRRIKLD